MIHHYALAVASHQRHLEWSQAPADTFGDTGGGRWNLRAIMPRPATRTSPCLQPLPPMTRVGKPERLAMAQRGPFVVHYPIAA